MTGETAPALVVAAWAGGNAVLAGLLALFGESGFAVTLFAAATALPALVAAAVAAAPARNADAQDRFRLTGGAQWAVTAACGLVLVGLGGILGVWFVILGAAAVLVSAVRLIRPSRPAEEPRDAAG